MADSQGKGTGPVGAYGLLTWRRGRGRGRGCGRRRPYGAEGWGLRRSLLLGLTSLVKPRFRFWAIGPYCKWVFGFVIGLVLVVIGLGLLVWFYYYLVYVCMGPG
ncbi:hypothetical protein E1A91_A11G278500v1 [Gossypium mustelinum]|uniref:Uncharacterized protein n=1 Tax=Gossypium mustelinum TaxID=34275 RepID=A0A5D2XBK5_GOSMU|nr:hypothetical protein E1A91_A11G278500v1 [Gossypium mustelinum]